MEECTAPAKRKLPIGIDIAAIQTIVVACAPGNQRSPRNDAESFERVSGGSGRSSRAPPESKHVTLASGPASACAER